MALIRAEIRSRLGESSIYDGIVERTSDFESEKMLQTIHPGSMMLCLNYPDENSTDSTEEASAPSDLYIKRLEGSWEKVIPLSAGVTPEDIVEATGDMTTEQIEQVLSNLGISSSVTPSDIVAATGIMTEQQAADTVSNLGVKDNFVINVSMSGGPPHADKSFAEINAAYNDGKCLSVRYSGYVFTNVWADNVSIEQAFKFIYLIGDDRTAKHQAVIMLLEVNSSDIWDYQSYIIMKDIVHRDIVGTTPTIEPAANTIYNCGTLTSLTISNPPATGKYVIIFYSGATATTTVGIENFVAEANKRYKITVEDNYATYDSWPYTPT